LLFYFTFIPLRAIDFTKTFHVPFPPQRPFFPFPVFLSVGFSFQFMTLRKWFFFIFFQFYLFPPFSPFVAPPSWRVFFCFPLIHLKSVGNPPGFFRGTPRFLARPLQPRFEAFVYSCLLLGHLSCHCSLFSPSPRFW